MTDTRDHPAGHPRDEPVAPFPHTRWSLVGRAGGAADPRQLREALDELLPHYLPALRAHLLLDRRIPRDRAEDLLQGFVADRVLERHLIAVADPGRGRFRTFLLTALDHYCLDDAKYRSRHVRSPAGGAVLSLDDDRSGAGRVADARGPGGGGADAFEAAWARQVVDQAVQRMRAECLRPDRQVNGGSPGPNGAVPGKTYWALFERRVLLPALEGVEPPPYERLVAEFGLRSATQAANLLITGKRMFARALRSVVAEYATGEHEVADEMRDLRTILSRLRA